MTHSALWFEKSNQPNGFVWKASGEPVAYRRNSLWLAGLLACAWGQAGEPDPHPVTPTHTFGRGFDLDRGTDLSVTLAGIPVNLPSTVWGPGYLDTNIWIAELEGPVQYQRGPYLVEEGGFALAGSVRKDLLATVERPSLTAEYGGAEADRFARMLWMDARPAGAATFSYALEGTRNTHPWDELDSSARLNAAFRLGREDRDRGWNLTILATHERGDGIAPDPLRPEPESEEELHEGDGIRSRRLLLGAGLRTEDGVGVTTRIQAYGGVSAQQSWGDYTYFLRDPEHGDQLELVDRRGFLGLEGGRQWRDRSGLFARWDYQAGFQARVDQVAAAEVFATQDRSRIQPLMQGQAALYHGALFAQGIARLGAGWRASLGLRLDTQRNQVTGTANPGQRSATLVSPKFGLAYRPVPDTEFSLNHGKGFRPGNAFRDPQPMTRATGTDLGAQTRILGPWTGGITLWTLDLDAETGLDPAWNAFVAQGRSRHRGLEWHNVVRQGPWSGELCLAWSQARFRDLPAGQDPVPGAVSQTGFLALGWQSGPLGLKASLKRLGAYALTPDNAVLADPQDALELRATREWRDWSVSVAVLNAFSKRKYNQEYYYLSRLAAEPAAVWDRHVRKADPQAIRLELTRRF
jgi:outer membrane receptor protein involved in Fe transport